MTPISSRSLFSPGQNETRDRRRWRILVVIPEQHLRRPRIPDPAAETEVSRQLIDAGYKVIDGDRIKEIRYDEHVARIIKGGANAEMEAIRLGRRFQADLLVTGEAFTQQVGDARVVASELGNLTQISCRARLELKALRLDTAEKVWSDAIHKTGAPEATEELASKITLQQAAEDITPRLLARLDKLSLSGAQTIELLVRDVPSATVGGDFSEALEKVPGIRDVGPGNQDGATLDMEIEVEKAAVKGLPRLLETHPALKRFALKVDRFSGSKIVVDMGPRAR